MDLTERAILPCAHLGCAACFEEVARRDMKCPVCREAVGVRQVMRLEMPEGLGSASPKEPRARAERRGVGGLWSREGVREPLLLAGMDFTCLRFQSSRSQSNQNPRNDSAGLARPIRGDDSVRTSRHAFPAPATFTKPGWLRSVVGVERVAPHAPFPFHPFQPSHTRSYRGGQGNDCADRH